MICRNGHLTVPEELAGQAEQLSATVDFFRLRGKILSKADAADARDDRYPPGPGSTGSTADKSPVVSGSFPTTKNRSTGISLVQTTIDRSKNNGNGRRNSTPVDDEKFEQFQITFLCSPVCNIDGAKLRRTQRSTPGSSRQHMIPRRLARLCPCRIRIYSLWKVLPPGHFPRRPRKGRRLPDRA